MAGEGYGEVYVEHVWSLYGEMECIMVNGRMVPPQPVDRQTNMTEDITFTTPLAGGKDSRTTKNKKLKKDCKP